MALYCRFCKEIVENYGANSKGIHWTECQRCWELAKTGLYGWDERAKAKGAPYQWHPPGWVPTHSG